VTLLSPRPPQTDGELTIPTGSVTVINGTTNEIIKDIELEGRPTSIAINEEKDKLYVTLLSPRPPQTDGELTIPTGSVTVINGTTNEIIKDIELEGRPTSIAINEEKDKLYVTLLSPRPPQTDGELTIPTGSVTVINGTTNEIIKDIELEGRPQSISYNPHIDMIYISIPLSNLISLINGTTDEIIENVATKGFIRDIEIDKKSNTIYLINASSRSLELLMYILDLTK
jgi:DNA-binding beta-propeller fold protein YncE